MIITLTETEYVRLKRIEKAAELLLFAASPDTPAGHLLPNREFTSMDGAMNDRAVLFHEPDYMAEYRKSHAEV